ncbi:MAG: hypothetical protein CO128_09690 [Ignavibacteriales bacterium CG_4_9_14_3_um_filter_30_11]|nr:MAG: hypothetical protein CO128_09690 [Ignavibacteriales bacterium CG_4_9_14_3_um_filter_30_11]
MQRAQWQQTNGSGGGTGYSLAVSGTNLFAGTLGGGVWRRPLSEIITYLEVTSSEPPNTFTLAQNYPNPFNPSTIIRYGLPKEGFVTLNVYDMLGREVKILVNEFKSAGSYSVDFNASNLASGIYFYQMQAGDFVQTKKLLLMK